MDVHTPAQRSFNMSRVRSKDTRPEMLIRQGLHSRGLRFRVHGVALPGKPDLIFTKHRAVIFVHGCFWHGHSCPLFKLPKTRREFWEAKISANKVRDTRTTLALVNTGWRVLTVWECALRGSQRQSLESLLDQTVRWLRGRETTMTLERLLAESSG